MIKNIRGITEVLAHGAIKQSKLLISNLLSIHVWCFANPNRWLNRIVRYVREKDEVRKLGLYSPVIFFLFPQHFHLFTNWECRTIYTVVKITLVKNCFKHNKKVSNPKQDRRWKTFFILFHNSLSHNVRIIELFGIRKKFNASINNSIALHGLYIFREIAKGLGKNYRRV